VADRSRLRQLSFAQQRLFFLSRLPGVSDAYHLPLAVRLAGPLDDVALARALDTLTDRHEVLRTRFSAVDGEPVGLADPPGRGFALRYEDLSGLPDQDVRLAEVQADEAAEPFDLETGPLARGRLIGLGPGRHALLITMHHIVSDGWSLNVLTRELSALYAAFASGRPDAMPPLPPLPVTYAGYAAWQRQWLASGVAGEQGTYWSKALAGAPALLDLPADRPRPAGQDHHGDQVRFELDAALTLRLRELSRKHGVTLFMTLLAGWAVVLSRLSGSADVLIGTSAAGRRRTEFAGLIGFFVNTLALRLDLSRAPAVADLLDRARETTLGALDHQDLPFEQVVELVNPPRSPDRTPLVQVMFGWASDEEEAITLPGVTVTPLPTPYAPAQFDLSLELAETGDLIIGKFTYATALFDQASAWRQVGYLRRVLAQMAAGPDRSVAALTLASPSERDRLLASADGAPGPARPLPLLPERFESQVARDPDAPAIVSADGAVLSYDALNARANQLARYLRAHGAGEDQLVAICAGRSPELITAMLAVLKAGAAYVPLDPGYPAERIAAMLADCRPRIVLTNEDGRSVLRAALTGLKGQTPPVTDLEADLAAWAGLPAGNLTDSGPAPHHLAYVIYTSGSTGTPNGVLVEHRHLAAIAAAWEDALGLRPGLTHLQMASPAFDVCTADVVRALGFGGRLVLCPRELLADEAGLYEFIGRHGVNFADFVPAVLGPLAAYIESAGGTLAGFETLVCGSDAWPAEDARRVRALAGPQVRVLNAYGVTEAAIDSARYELPAGPGGPCRTSPRLPIGRPLPGVRLYLLDESGEPVPDGVTGEICIGGAGVARGYLRRPDLTARRFKASPFVAGDRLYLTGDLGRRRPDGEVELLGRRDFQVKLRGLRVEPGDIEAALARCAGVRAAVVTTGPAGGRLVAYYLAVPGQEPDVAALRDQLAAVLPGYMVPSAYIALDAWPLTVNGKVDRTALPPPDLAGDAASADDTGPATAMETALAPLWEEVLGAPRAGRHDDFFALGGHSLAAMRLVAKVRRALGREASPAAVLASPTLAGFARRLETEGSEPLPPIGPADRSGQVPASFAQQRLWFLAQLGAASDAYHMAQAWELAGPLDPIALSRAWDALTARHESLRTRFAAASGTAVLVIDPAGPPLGTDDLSAAPGQEARLAELRVRAAAAPFDLQAGPLARARLVTLAPERHAFLVTVHHIISDGWSMDVLARELSALYAAFAAGQPNPLPPLPVQYADYAAWQRAWPAEATARQAGFWSRALDGAPAELALPADRSRPAEQDYRGDRVRFELDAELSGQLAELSRKHGVTLFMTLLAAWALVLSRLSGSEDVVIGTPTAGRRRDELAGLIGFFVNTLALRVDLAGGPDLAGLLRRVRDVTLAALDHQDLPFERVVELAAPARSLARTPLFQTMLTWQDDFDEALTLPGLTAAPLGDRYPVAKFDLTLGLAQIGGQITGALDYATALFDQATARRYVRYLRQVLGHLAVGRTGAVTALPLTSEAERSELLAWAAVEPGPEPVPIGELFEKAAAENPQLVAVAFEDQSMTYGELNDRASRLASHLRGLGVGPDRRVAVCLRRSPDLIVALAAVLKAGGAYVPLDPAYPAERLAFMLADSEPMLVLTQQSLRECLPDVQELPVVCLDSSEHARAGAMNRCPPASRHPDHLAYVIYTSGSTGRPKGVAQTWRCADALIAWMLARPVPARVLQFASASFDVSFQEIWSTLCAGATLVLLSDDRRADLGNLRRFLAEHDVGRAFLPAAVLRQVAALNEAALNEDSVQPPSGCEIVTAGEALAVTGELRALSAGLGGEYLHNHYGPTETHAATAHALAIADVAEWPALPPIGRPIPGARVYVLDAGLEPVPEGVVGEIYIGGEGLARGYIGRPALTADRFWPDPFSGDGARMYRTGDLARYRRNGVIDYVGRADSQVKIRGFRVEPDEVEAVLRDIDGVTEAAVAVSDDIAGGRYLTAYVTGSLTVAEIRDLARQVLPDYLVPSRWVLLDRLPLTRNGKVDRQALPPPAEDDGGTPYVAPRTTAEGALAAIWAEVLGRERVGVLDDFFALGGHSLLATRLMHAINQRLSARLSLRDLFSAPVLADLALRLARGDGDEAAAYVFPALTPDLAARHEPFPLTDMQEAYWVGRQESVELGGVGAYGYSELRLRELDLDRFSRAIDRLVARHDMLRAVFGADGTQRVLPVAPPYRIPVHDLRGLTPSEATARLEAIRDRLSHQVFDASRWPLFAFAVTRLDDETRLHIGLDALIVDVASSQVLERELGLLYADADIALPPLWLTFRDYVLAERALRATPRYERALRYWRERVATLAPAPVLPLATAPETVRRPRYVRYERVLPAGQWSALKASAHQRGVTPSALLLTAFAEVLGRWSREPRFTLSLPLFNRLPLHPDINAVIGDFTSLILVEVDLSGPASFAERARAVQDRLWRDIDHAAVSGVRVNRELARARGTAHAAIPIVFNSTLSELAPEAADGGLSGALGAEPVTGITQTPQVWIDHTILEAGGRLCYNWDSLDELFPAGMTRQMFAAYGELLTRLAEPDAWDLEAPALFLPGPDDRASVALADWPLLHELADRQALATPDAPAVISPGRTLSYRELRCEARRLARALQDRGLRSGDLVAVLADRGWEQAVATLAVLHAGGAYVPIDPAWPPARIAGVLKRTRARIALVQEAQPGRLALPADVEALVVGADHGGEAEPLSAERAPSDLAYVIYTSGSTGTPKGVMIDHKGAVNTILDINGRFGVVPGDRLLALSSLSFDLSVFDLFGAFAAGAALVTLEPELARDPAHWADLAAAHKVTVWNSVPALLGLLIDYARASGFSLPGSLRLALLSGDWIPVTLPGEARALLPDLAVHSLGGATEASIWSIHYPIGAVDPAWRSIPYGWALSGQSFHVLDEAMRPSPDWVVGELYIGGIGLALGYLDDEETTAASFVHSAGLRLYRTGDLGRRWPDGTIEFLGREDGQVKIHGYRVELGEIEAMLETHEGVKAAAVRLLGRPDGDKYLTAYVVARGEQPEADALAAHLSAALPGYMVPASYTYLEALPLSANGKVDRGRLPEPAADLESAAAPAGPDEERIRSVVGRVLGTGRIAAGASLLTLGATSLDIVRIANALRAELGFRPKIAALMRQPTLSGLVHLYRDHAREREATAGQPVVEGQEQRAAFKARALRAGKPRAPGRRTFNGETASVALPAAGMDAIRRYGEYRSVRSFARVPVDGRDLGTLLGCLAAREIDGTAKYLYGSAGGAYPMQTYLYVKPGRVAGVAGGAHYYDPQRHRLVELGRDRVLDADAYDYFVNRPVFESGAFAVFLVAELAAIEPLYGEASLGFCQIEAGAMAQLLTMTAPGCGIGLCGIGSVEYAAVTELLGLSPTHRLVYSMVGGAREDARPGVIEAAEMEDLAI
jgi:amino acid adenylation domain-containing protein